jgi:hypothetical protein
MHGWGGAERVCKVTLPTARGGWGPQPVFRIRIHRIHVFFGLPDLDPLFRGMDPDPALDPDAFIIMQKQ